MELFILLIFVPVTHSVKHSLTYFLTTSSGLVETFPEFVLFSEIDGVQLGYCDSINLTMVFKPDWVKKLNEDNSVHLEGHNMGCRTYYYDNKAILEGLKQHFNQTEGVHILQIFAGSEWDDETGDNNEYYHTGYDGEDFITMDMKNQRWLYTERAATYKDKWDPDKTRLYNEHTLLKNEVFPWLKTYLTYVKSSLLRKVRPSVSLLQKYPSSPVSCHATGFYPDRATMFWRKDGEELHEDVDHGEILPNHDGTFQMRVDLMNISSVKPGDWRRYDCVFHLHDTVEIITKLDKAVIRTNRENTGIRNNEVSPVGAVIGVVVGLMLLSACITGLFFWRKKKQKKKKENGFQPANCRQVTHHTPDL